MAKKESGQGETKTEFLKKALGKSPDLTWDQINRRWVKKGHPGEISNSLFYQVRSRMGIRTVWEWVKNSDDESQSKPVGELFQIKITLLGTKPPIWRRVQVRDGTLEDLHNVIQLAMGWTNSHMHQFRIGEVFYADPNLMEDAFDDLECVDSTKTKLSDVLLDKKRGKIIYEYDFGDSWEHEIQFEKQIDPEPKVHYPRCIEGKRACPPEDVGGVWGYAEFLDAMANPMHERHEEFQEWFEGKFDPEDFSVDATNGELNRIR